MPLRMTQYFAIIVVVAVVSLVALPGCGGDKSTNPIPQTSVFQIAFVGIGGGLKYDIYMINSDGSSRRNLTNTSAWNEQDPFFSKDGRKIVYSSDEGGSSQIWVMKSDGTGRHSRRTGDEWCSLPLGFPECSTSSLPIPGAVPRSI